MAGKLSDSLPSLRFPYICTLPGPKTARPSGGNDDELAVWTEPGSVEGPGGWRVFGHCLASGEVPKTHRAQLLPSRNHKLAIRAEGWRSDGRITVSNVRVHSSKQQHVFPGCGIVEASGRVQAPARNQLAIRAKDCIDYPIHVPTQNGNTPARRGFPDPRSLVVAGGHNPLAIRAERRAEHGARMSLKHGDGLPAGGIPDPGSVITAGRDDPPVRNLRGSHGLNGRRRRSSARRHEYCQREQAN